MIILKHGVNHESPLLAAKRLSKKLLNKGYYFIALHEYHNEQEQVLYWRIRLKHPISKQKWVRPLSCHEKGFFQLKEPCFTALKPLYRLPDIIKNPTNTVWIVEGELCADCLAKFNISATSSGGVESVMSADWSPLAKREVIIWPDNDDAGMRYAEQVSLQLLKLNTKVKWIDVAKLNLPLKGDCVDWLECNPHMALADINNLPLISPQLTNPADKNESDNNENKSAIKFNNALVKTSSKTQQKLFYVKENGIFYVEEESHYWICSKLEIIALTRDAHSENWGRLLYFHDADGYQHRWAMPMQMLKGSAEELCGELLRLGLEIAPGAKARRLIVEYLTTTNKETRAVCVNRIGWHQQYFVLPEITFGQGIDQVIYQAETANKDYKQLGTLHEWQTNVAQLCVGNFRLILAISSAFAAMLLHPLGVESGGLHFVGESSCGKTTALRVAASVFSEPSYVNRWRATTNGLEALAAQRSDTLLILDELAQVDPKEAGEMAYLLANGMGKARAIKTGVSKQRQEWRLIFLSAGEVNLAQHMRESGKTIKAGQSVRLTYLLMLVLA